ncbi:MAG TPA: 2-phospho-L-lactate guanylyltransferase [Deltaproteobacteria bacterium]|nr:2-phospho-L-lactate guanylyltransferase [Deltaproteobacteria bacterium]
MTIALIPVKRLEESKSRLLSRLPGARRQALTLAMLDDLIEALGRTPGVGRIAITTPDPIVAERARTAGAEVLIRAEPGLNAALEDGRTRLASAGDAAGGEEDLLIVLGDVAGATPEDFASLLEAARHGESPGVWLAPSRDGGTSALLQHPAGAIACCFGRESARRHREAARAAGVAYHEIELASLAIDLDQPEDLEAFLETRGGGPRTRALLEDVSASTPPSTSPATDPATTRVDSRRDG